MTLSAPDHLIGTYRYKPNSKELLEERRLWIIEQRRAGHFPTVIANALGISLNPVDLTLSAARKEGLLPPATRGASSKGTSSKPKKAPAPPKAPAVPEGPRRTKISLAPGKSVMTFYGQSKDTACIRVSLPSIPGEERMLRPDFRPETNPRFTLVQVAPRPQPNNRVTSIIETIQEMALTSL